ncbi:MAG: hypothetical protein R3A79_11495 [Nannocystaceae bacterium]
MKPRHLVTLGVVASTLAGACTKTAPPGAEADAAVAAADEANTCDAALRAEVMAALDGYCAYEPSLEKQGLVPTPDDAATFAWDRRYYVLVPGGMEMPEAPPKPPAEYVEIWVEREEPFGVAIVADTPAKDVAALLEALEAKGIREGKLQFSRPRTVARPQPPNPAELARVRASKSREEAYGPLLGCLDWVAFSSAGVTVAPDQRCRLVREHGVDTWFGCGCPGEVSVFKQHLLDFAVGWAPTELTPAAIDFVLDESAAIEVAPTTTWAELVERLPAARPIPLWIKLAEG